MSHNKLVKSIFWQKFTVHEFYFSYTIFRLRAVWMNKIPLLWWLCLRSAWPIPNPISVTLQLVLLHIFRVVVTIDICIINRHSLQRYAIIEMIKRQRSGHFNIIIAKIRVETRWLRDNITAIWHATGLFNLEFILFMSVCVVSNRQIGSLRRLRAALNWYWSRWLVGEDGGRSRMARLFLGFL